jgi:5'-phosphate synthase pdxT subunit
MNNGNQPVGILALQGDFELHAKMLERIGAPWTLVKYASELGAVGGLILPGGESTTMLKFLSSPAEGGGGAPPRPPGADPGGPPDEKARAVRGVTPTLGEAIRGFAERGKPVFGTCAGAILLAKEVLNPPQEHLDLIDISIERNAYGRQIDSSVRLGDCPELTDRPVEMVFIRAPIIRRLGEGVRVLGRSDGLPVLVEQGNILAATFHPELTENETIHRYFLRKL